MGARMHPTTSPILRSFSEAESAEKPMSTKHLREINRRVGELVPNTYWDWYFTRTNHSHHVLNLEYNGRTWKIQVSSSPRDKDHCVDNAMQDVKRVIQYATIVTKHVSRRSSVGAQTDEAGR